MADIYGTLRADHAAPVPSPGGASGLIPVQYVNDIIQESVKSSVSMRAFRTMRMPAAVSNLPVLSVLPTVSWVGELPTETPSSRKPATKADWTNVVLTARELAAIVVIPEATLADATVDLWAEIRPLLGQAIGKAVDNAVLFGGTSGATVPTGWPNGLLAQAVAASQSIDLSTVIAASGDFYDAAAQVFEKVEEDGYPVTVVLGGPLLKSKLRRERVTDTKGQPMYVTRPGSLTDLWGVDIEYVDNGAWQASDALFIAGDRSKVIVGIRQDITFKFLDQASIDVSSDPGTPNVINLAQNDMVALRVVFRVAYATANPVTPLSATPFPFGALVP